MKSQYFNATDLTDKQRKIISDCLKSGGVAVLPSDTIYGIFASAFSEEGVEKIFNIKFRDEKKPLIVHISSMSDISKFNIGVSEKLEKFLWKLWPGPFSVILPSSDFEYLHRGTNGLAFRLIKYRPLLEIIKEVGPLVGTSTNPEGMKSAETIEEAKQYFDNKIDLFLDAGHLPSVPSTVIDIKNGQVKIIRQGAGKLPFGNQGITL